MIRALMKGALLLVPAIPAAIASDSYPNKPIRLVVPWAAGASSHDILGRALAQRLTEQLGQNVIVDNRPGAGGVIGSDLVAKAAPDGYTLLLGTNGPIAVSQHVLKKMPYNPMKDLVPVAMSANIPYVLVANPGVQAKDVKELIALAKAKPGQLLYASSGIASTPHLCGELLKTRAGVNIVHVPYKGGAPAHTDTIAGHVHVYCSALGSQLPQIRAGRLRALAVTTLQRSPLLPELPTMSEQGFPGFDVGSWSGIMAPAGLPRQQMERLHKAIAKITESQEWKTFLQGQGFEPVTMDSKQMSAYIQEESENWAKVVKAANIIAD